MTDPIADMLTRLRNAVIAKHARVDVPASKLKLIENPAIHGIPPRVPSFTVGRAYITVTGTITRRIIRDDQGQYRILTEGEGRGGPSGSPPWARTCCGSWISRPVKYLAFMRTRSAKVT